MAGTFDPKDVPVVAGAEMQAALHAVIHAERALVFFQGADAADLRAIEEEFWNRFEGSRERGGVILLRLWHLIDALQARRLKDRVMRSGLSAIEAAVKGAGQLRLNMAWGFAPQKIIWAINESEERERVSRSRPVRLQPSQMPDLAIAA
ncbi:MAG: hypothetical protein K0U74_08950 [Alphaproteobacteria bacterium]|nr:hypothetical protein [Alphaproteobacteria bacterium]